MILEMVTSENFRDEDYLNANPDARNSILNGEFETAREHYNSHNQEIRYQYKKFSAPSPCELIVSTSGSRDLLKKIEGNFIHLENVNSNYKNIYAEPDFLKSDKIGLTSQFQEHSGQYHAKYYNPQLFIHYLKLALEMTGIDYAEPDIFDFGSGSGNSVFAALEVFDRCSIMASDLSVELLSILNTIREEQYPDANIPCIAMDIQKTRLKDSSFDIFMGLAILHHVIEPDIVFEIAYNALKRNGCLILFEPMIGYQILGGIYKTIVAMDRFMDAGERLPENIKSALNALSFDYLVRVKMYDEMIHCKITDLDDKWIFSSKHIIEMAERAGFKTVKIQGLAQHPRYKSELAGVLPLVDVDIKEMPEWAIEIIANFDLFDIESGYNDVHFASAVVCIKD